MTEAPDDRRRQRGKQAYLSGLAAEDIVERIYCDRGAVLAARRWRGGGAEIDLIFRKDAVCIFVEVKKSKDWSRASQKLSASQIGRIMTAASVFVGEEPMGQLTEMRFDVALVDEQGQTQILENALMIE